MGAGGRENEGNGGGTITRLFSEIFQIEETDVRNSFNYLVILKVPELALGIWKLVISETPNCVLYPYFL